MSSPFNIGEAILGAAGGFLGGIGSAIGSAIDADANRKISADNLSHQRDVFNYQKELQEKVFSREDNAIQRRVADLKLAGLHPALAAGKGAGTGAVVNTAAPQNQYRSTQGRETGAAFGKMSGVATQAALSAMQSAASIRNTQAQNDLIAAQAKKVQAETSRIESVTPYEVDLKRAASEVSNATVTHDIRRAFAGASEAEDSAALKKIQVKAADLGITSKELDIVKQQITNQIVTKNLSIKEQEILANSIAIATKQWNLNYASTTSLPTGHASNLKNLIGSGMVGTSRAVEVLINQALSAAKRGIDWVKENPPKATKKSHTMGTKQK